MQKYVEYHIPQSLIEIQDKTSYPDKDLLLRYLENLIDEQTDQVFEWSFISVSYLYELMKLTGNKPRDTTSCLLEYCGMNIITFSYQELMIKILKDLVTLSVVVD